VQVDFTLEEAAALAAALPETPLAADCLLAIAGKLPLARCATLQAAIESYRAAGRTESEA
jgi:hypothetical protein